ncbi:MAG: EAL domain-containing protein, partial [Oscillospiraceae bacterium]
EGNAITSDDHEFSVADRDFFKAAVKGERFISQPIIDKVDGVTPGIVYAVPVFHDGEVVNVLFSGYELNKLTERIDISFYHKSGLAFIVNSNSDILLHPNEIRRGKNLVDVAKIKNDAEEVEIFQKDLKKGKGGVAHFIMNEENRFFAYAPIKDANDWFLVTSLPSTAVFERSKKVILLSILLLMLVLILFAMILLYIVVTKKRANEKIIKLAYSDSLTSEPNAEKFKMDAKELFQQFGAQKYTLLNFDVKQFRYINNDLGYTTGNELLIYITYCLKNVLGKDEIFTRVGTDQFLLLFLSCKTKAETLELIEKIRSQISKWQPRSGAYRPVQLAFGVYKIEDKSEDIMKAIEKSNIARKASKIDYELDVAFYDSEMQRLIDRDTELDRAMPTALKNDEFKLFIQPKYDLVNEKIVGGEALVRWIKDDGTIISPGDFIPLFEQTGAIYSMDMYMLDKLCKFLRSQLDRGISAVPISINQSRRYMYNPDYVNVIREKLHDNGVATNMVELEITENLVYTDLNKLIQILNVLHKDGFKLSIDDFGSGYSSLNVLKDLPVNTLKLDRFMLSEILNSKREKIIIANIIRMAKELNMSVVAEGVETYEQAKFLRDCDCEMAQGFYYSKPVTAEQFEKLLCDQAQNDVAKS